ncbi:FAS1-like dehydratase domain-containing protein [Denitromonas ohlonensis]|uniref:MaoC family dehydratase n=2 Tax=Denitromonas TaxID=139331 RepID=A0A558CIU1_9RHOO|nr:MaoC family dehydratase N-terminal domain-containing protein [Denitromonas ohlonensis]TVT48689.1 MAG: MaoC family dehydratase [Denitromonas halophila]TVO63558.1 MaoC family dehydratase [Denitromonas ohlonensis]TVO75435.1 MaoC family dehydratase [Denitromonas ohlonensis]TVT70566.1 MAG: MaoC family dehydratase [Denitromonas halophila]TVT75688.1 MAG: MaoC family dehydratase [Denitromonas halophila]
MAIDRAHIGDTLAPFDVVVEPAALAAFADAIGETDPVYRHEIAPPTFMKVLEGKDNSSRRIMEALGVDLRRILHAEQRFEYHAPIRCGETVTVNRRVADISSRKEGLLELVLIETQFKSATGGLLGTSIQTVMVRNPKPGAT